MKQHEILYQFFKTPKDKAIKFCVNVNADYKLNVLGIHYIIVPNANKLPKNYLNRQRHYIGGGDLKKVEVVSSGISGPYHPGAEYPVKSLETIVPDSMDFEIHAAVSTIKDEVGSINQYVISKLKYKSVDELASALSAEQVDAVAMIIYNIEEKGQGMIIGDQTGIGKGRVAAAVIRYGCVSGKKPIFCTEKPNLFSDIYRDLKAIGSADLKPFIVNSNEGKTKVKDDDGEVIYEAPAQNVQQKIFASGKIPAEYDYVMMTYSQVASEKPTAKQSFVSSIATDNILILDESHNAGGNIETSFTAKFFYDAVKSTKGVVFLSATFAKRPDNMPLYAAKTCLSEASMSNTKLIEAIQSGGNALQEVLSANLVAEGQMIRRERSFDGVEVNYITLDANGARDYGVEDKEQEHRAIADRITDVLRDIVSFQNDWITPVVDKMDEAVKAEMAEIEQRQGTKDLGVDSPPFFSKLFNVVNQMLFSIKAKAVAQRAIQRLNEGKKPVIAFSNTMAAFLESMENERGNPIQVGDKVNTDFTEVLKRGLDGIFRISKKNASGKTEKDVITIGSLPEEAQKQYHDLVIKIQNISTGISISPIDVIKTEIESAGYSVAEVTGRKLEVKLERNSMVGVVMPRTKENTNDAFRRFNNNQVDVLMINQAGSTGASAHAIVTPKVPLEKVKQRVMIILQAELDINREVQKRGRTNRTGQVYKPIYDYVNSAIPAEKRLSMMLQKKLKSLDANTTSNQKNSEALLKSEDFLNKYGDKIVFDYLKDNPKLNDVIGDPLKLNDSEVHTNLEDAAHRVTGRVAILATSDQQKFYSEMVERYNKMVRYLVQSGEYDLEVEQMNLDAESIEKKIAVAGNKSGRSVFAEHSYIEECMVNNLRKPFTKIELENRISEALGGKNADDIQREQLNQIDEYFEKKQVNENAEINSKHDYLANSITNEKKYQGLKTEADRKGYIEGRLKEIESGREAALKLSREKIQNNHSQLRGFFRALKTGVAYRCPFASYDNQNVPGVFLGFSIDYKKSNPFTPSAITAQFAIANSLKYMELVLSGEQGNKVQSVIGASVYMPESERTNTIENWDYLCKESSSPRKKVYIYTGNILQAYAVANGGKLISYTTKSGDVKKGILMPDSWKPSKKDGSERTIVPLINAIKVIKGLVEGTMLSTDNDVTIMRTRYGFRLITKGLSVQKFGWLLKHTSILSFITNVGGFQKQSSTWIGDVDSADIDKVLNLIYEATKTSVGLSEAQMQLVADEFERVEKEKKTVFPKLVELEVLLFKMIEEDKSAFSGLGLPANAINAIDTIKRHHPLKTTDPKGKLIADMVDEVARKTNNFKNVDAISDDKVEVKPLLEKEKISPAEWLQRKNSLRRSEADVVEWLAQKVMEMVSVTDTLPSDRERKLKLAKAKAKALILIQMQTKN